MTSILLDFDGTCVQHEYPYVGDDIGAQQVLHDLVKNGHQLILFTMRSPINTWTMSPGTMRTKVKVDKVRPINMGISSSTRLKIKPNISVSFILAWIRRDRKHRTA